MFYPLIYSNYLRRPQIAPRLTPLLHFLSSSTDLCHQVQPHVILSESRPTHPIRYAGGCRNLSTTDLKATILVLDKFNTLQDTYAQKHPDFDGTHDKVTAAAVLQSL